MHQDQEVYGCVYLLHKFSIENSLTMCFYGNYFISLEIASSYSSTR
jgi:hypothetical protein